MITQMFEDISSFRQRSVVDALKIRREYAGETSIKPSLTTVERNVIGYIAGYVCCKTRDRLQRSNSERVSRLYGQVARESSRPKPESCRPKFIVMSPDILSHVARNFIMLKKILKLLVRVKRETMKLRLFVSLSFSCR